ncbi:DUF3052 family protein [Acidobacteria bacterium AB60]|nr:DUF3052 family protein [Acidobacteria bacterium AB60]
MGREAECACDWNGKQVEVRALIEPPDLILRGGFRQRLPLAELENVSADGDQLRFRYRGETVALVLGTAMVARWLKSLTAPPPTLAKKMGISAKTAIRIFGSMDDPALTEAVSAAASTSARPPDLILARVNIPAELESALECAAEQIEAGVPIWFIYPKGKGSALGENQIRAKALAAGMVDTKVAAVSATLTALRFVKRKQPAGNLG